MSLYGTRIHDASARSDIAQTRRYFVENCNENTTNRHYYNVRVVHNIAYAWSMNFNKKYVGPSVILVLEFVLVVVFI